MKITYDPKFNIAYVALKNKVAEVNSIKLSDDLVVDMAPDGTIYGQAGASLFTSFMNKVVTRATNRKELK